MTDRDLWLAAWKEITLTTDPYPTWVKKGKPASSHFAKAKAEGDQIGAVTPPPADPPPPSLLLGTGLQNRKQADGDIIKVTTYAQLVDVTSHCDEGSIVDASGMPVKGLGGTTMVLSRPCLVKPIEVLQPRLVDGGTDGCLRIVAPGWRIRNGYTGSGRFDGLKQTDDAYDVELIGHVSENNKAQGYMISGKAGDFTHRDCQANGNGHGSTLDHGWYVASCDGKSEILNPKSQGNGGYDIVVQYTTDSGLLISMPSLLGGGDTLRSGIVYSYGSKNSRTVGAIVQNAAVAAAHGLNESPLPSGHSIKASYWWNCAAGFVKGYGLDEVPDPATSNALSGPVPADLYALVTEYAANGIRRVPGSVKAGYIA